MPLLKSEITPLWVISLLLWAETLESVAKQDCEINAAKRYLKKLHQDFPQLGFLLGGDALFSKQPIIEEALRHHMHYLFAAKPDDYKYMMEWLDMYSQLDQMEFIDQKGRRHCYEWMNEVPLNGNQETIYVNFLRCTITGKKLLPFQNHVSIRQF